MENHTKYQESIYFRSLDDSALYVNLYADSTLRWPERGFAVTQATRYPAEGESRITVDGSGPLEIKLRVPAWVGKDYTVRINGIVQDIAGIPGTYVTLNRQWRPGDTIDISMPFRFRVERALDSPAVQSIFYGPILMAVQGGAVGNSLESGLMNFSFYRYLQAGWRSRSGHDAHRQAAAFHDERPNVGPVLHRRSRAFGDEPVPSLYQTARAQRRVWFDRLRRGQPLP